MGFISAGPWDLIGHAEVSEEKTDGKIARHLDRDDMVANTINTFCSLTVHCAQCHDHKFDPISAADYYGLQSDFAALDRADRTYDVDPEIAEQRTALEALAAPLREQLNALNERARTASGEGLKALEKTLADARLSPSTAVTQGWHSKMESTPDVIKWVQVDLGTAALTRQVILHPCSDSYNSIGDGFGFPVRFKIEAANDPEFKTGVTLIADATAEEVPNPGIRTQTFPAHAMARYVRLTVTTLGSRKDGFMVALAEMEVLDEAGKNLTTGSQVTSLDSIEAGGRWSTAYLGDGHYPGSDPAKITPTANTKSQIEKLEQARMLMLEAMLGEKDLATFRALTLQLADVAARQQALPPAQLIYAGTIHHGSGTFLGTGAQGGKPRAVTVLMRGDVKHPGPPATPGALKAIAALPGEFSLPPDAPESARRVALARWLTAAENPLTWRSIVNRVWQYHFGHGLVETANDFGHMGAFPTHPELLDWLAATFRDDLHGSLKELHRLIVTSATYRQSSLSENPAAAESDADNHLLWRQNRRKLEAEAVRDSVLAVAGKLDLRMGGPSFQDFVITHPEHSPHYEYDQADPENPALHRRSVYRFLVRSQQQPWMATLDCADPSMLVERRNQTITPLQALAQLNNALMLTMARHFAERLEGLESTLPARIDQAFQLALQRPPTADEHAALLRYATDSGLANACRVLFNLNEFTFVD